MAFLGPESGNSLFSHPHSLFSRVQWDSGNSLFGILTNTVYGFFWVCHFLFSFIIFVILIYMLFSIFVHIFDFVYHCFEYFCNLCYFDLYIILHFWSYVWFFDSKICLLFFCRFCPELGPGSVTIGFFAKNYTGYANSRPNCRQESLFYDHFMFLLLPLQTLGIP